MKIAVDIRCLTDRRLTGVGWYTLNLVRSMAQLAPFDRFVLFASGTNDTLDRLPTIRGANISVVECPVPNNVLSLYLVSPRKPALEDFLPEMPDVWLFPHPNISRTRLPYALTIHDLTLSLFPQFFTRKDHWRERLVGSRSQAQGAQRLLAVSSSTKNDIVAHWRIARENITVTHLGVDATAYGGREQASDRSFRAAYDLNRPYLLTLATHEPRKNLESVIDAYDAFRAEGGSALPLVVVGGNGWRSAVTACVRKSVYRNDIRLLGYAPEKHKPALYRGATVFLFPSFYEGFGLPVLEAMSCGTPVITSFAGSLPEVAQGAALYVDPYNVNDLVHALHVILDRKHGADLRTKMRAEGMARAKAFSWNTTAALTLDALRETAGLTP